MNDAGFVNYYTMLDLPETASTNEIKQRYHELVAFWHPDVNKASNATEITAALNEAWNTLRDPSRRQAYDSGLKYVTEATAEEISQRLVDLIACQGCGAIDHTLSVVAFTYTISLLIMTVRQPTGGVLCDRCRGKRLLVALGVSLLFGWWGFPWGPIYTVQAIYYALIGGAREKNINVALLNNLGLAFWQRGVLDEAHACFARSYMLQPDARVKEALDELRGSVEASTVRNRPLTQQYVAIAAVVALPILLFLLLIGLISSTNTESTAQLPGSSQQSRDDAQLKALASKCYAAADRNQDAQNAYDACNKALTWIQGDLKAAASGTIAYQGYSLARDNIRVYKGVAAYRIGRRDESKQLVSQSAADLIYLRDNGLIPDIRVKARKNYNCLVNNVC